MTTTTLPQDLAEVLDRVAAALGAMGEGDPAPYAALWADSADVTLYGAWGPMDRGHDTVTSTFRWGGAGSPAARWCPRTTWWG